MTPRRVAVIDIGKTNAKVVLIDRETGETIDSRARPNEVLLAQPYPHYDLEGLWDFILAALSDFAAQGVDGISITTHGAAAVIVNENGPVLPALDYEFDGPEEVAADYAVIRPDFAETLSPKLPVGLNLGAQIFWQAKRYPKAFARGTAILMYPQYWAWRLTGVMASEVTSLGTHTDLWQPDGQAFSSLVSAMAWEELFPPFKSAASVLGSVSAEVATQTGLPASTPVTCGIHDSNATLLPYLNAGKTSIIASGTWTICMTLGGDIAGLDPSRDSLANVDALGRPVPTARFMGGREFELLAEPATPADPQVVIDSGAMILPTFTLGIGPFPNAEGREVGEMSAPERAAAIRLYLALMTDTCLSLAGVGEKIIVEGPLAKDDLYLSLLAALTGKPTFKSADETGTSAGAAMLFDDLEHPTNRPSLTPITPAQLQGLQDYKSDWLKAAGS